MTIFEDAEDFAVFEKVLLQAVERRSTRLLAHCLLPNHWHLIVWPRQDGELPQFMGWLTLTHTQRWHALRQSAGAGHVYQGRFKSFPIQDDEHFYTVARYVERNALRANLTKRAEQWPWRSLYRWRRGGIENRQLLAAWPLPRERNWVDRVNAAQTEVELAALRRSTAVRSAIHPGAKRSSADWASNRLSDLEGAQNPPTKVPDPFLPISF